MEIYKRMYLTFFNAITDAIEKLDNEDIAGAMIRLAAAQCQCEEMFIIADDT